VANFVLNVCCACGLNCHELLYCLETWRSFLPDCGLHIFPTRTMLLTFFHCWLQQYFCSI